MGGLNITIYGYVKHFFVMKSVNRYDCDLLFACL